MKSKAQGLILEREVVTMEDSDGRKLYAGGTYKDGLHGEDIHGNIIDISSYQKGNKKREEFVRQTREGVTRTPVPRRNEGADSRANEAIINRRGLNNALRYMEETKKAGIKFRADKAELRRARAYKARRRKGRLKILGVAGLAALLAIAGGTKIADNIDASKTVNLEQALQSGQTLEELGISQEARGALANLEIDFGASNINALSNQELIEKASELEKLQDELFDSKLRKGLGLSDKASINVTTIGDETEKTRGIQISDNNTSSPNGFYSPEGFMVGMFDDRTYSKQIDDYIDSMESVEALNKNLQNANIDRNTTTKTLSEAIESTDKFAAGVIKTDEKGNIKFEAERLSEYEKNLKTGNVQKDDDLEL